MLTLVLTHTYSHETTWSWYGDTFFKWSLDHSSPSPQACLNMTLFLNVASLSPTSLNFPLLRYYFQLFRSNLIGGNMISNHSGALDSHVFTFMQMLLMQQALTFKKHQSQCFSFKPQPICCGNSEEDHWATSLKPQACLWCLFYDTRWKKKKKKKKGWVSECYMNAHGKQWAVTMFGDLVPIVPICKTQFKYKNNLRNKI